MFTFSEREKNIPETACSFILFLTVQFTVEFEHAGSNSQWMTFIYFQKVGYVSAHHSNFPRKKSSELIGKVARLIKICAKDFVV